jgi:hypothetical protein
MTHIAILHFTIRNVKLPAALDCVENGPCTSNAKADIEIIHGYGSALLAGWHLSFGYQIASIVGPSNFLACGKGMVGGGMSRNSTLT